MRRRRQRRKRGKKKVRKSKIAGRREREKWME